MATLATLIVKLAADVGGFSAEMEKAALKSQRAAERVGRDWKRMGDQLASVGRGMTMAFTLPIVAGAAAAVKAASDESESWNKVTVVFGENAAAIQTWAADSATDLGLSRQAAYEATGTFGNLFTAMGMSQESSADMSMDIVQLASDLASFNNIDPTVALDKLQSGLVGQSKPLRELGINLTEAAVAAKAMEMGLADADGELSEAAKIQARYALIVEQSTNAAGDFARTSDGLANQTRITKAKIEDMAASIGQMLLPYALQLVTWIQSAVSWFQALDPGIQKNILVALGLVAVLGPLLIVIGSVVGAIGTLIPIVTAVGAAIGAVTAPVWLAIAAIIAVVALLYAAWVNDWGGIQEKMAAVWAWLQPILMQLWTWLSTNLTAALASLAIYWQTVLLPAIMAVWSFIQTVLWPLFLVLVNFLGAVFGVAITALAAVWQNVLQPALQGIWDFISLSLWPLFKVLVQFMGAVFGLAIRVLAAVWQNVLQPALQAIWGFVNGSLFPLFKILADFLGAVFGLAIRVLAGVWKNVLQPALKDVWEWLGKIYNKIKNDVQPLLTIFGIFIESIISKKLEDFREILDAIKQSFQRIAGAVQGVIQKIKDMIVWLNSVDIPDWLGGGGGGGGMPSGGGEGGGSPFPMAAGGNFLVTRPTLFLAGEAGPEWASFSGANNVRGSGAGNTYITVNPHYYKGDEPTLLEELKLIGALTRAA